MRMFHVNGWPISLFGAALSCAMISLSGCGGPSPESEVTANPDAIVRHESSEAMASPEAHSPEATVSRALEGFSSESASSGGVEPLSSSYSFTRSCRYWDIYLYSDGSEYISAYCRRINGSWRWTSWGRGFCSRDMTNCDGYLRCGGCG